MTKEQLDAIRARVDNARYRHWLGDKEALLNNAMNDLLDLLAEVERLTAEYGRVVETNRQVATHVDRIRAERDAARAEVEMLRGVGCMEDGDGPCGACRKCAFARGVAAMREAAANVKYSCGYCSRAALQRKIRALPDPEDK